MEMKKLSNKLVLMTGIFIFNFFLIIFILLVPKSPKANYDAKVESLGICLDNKNLDIVEEIGQVKSNTLYLCGDLNTDYPTMIGFYIYREGEGKPVYASKPGEVYAAGPFFRELDKEIFSSPNTYLVEVYVARKVIGETKFVVHTDN